MSSDRKMWAQWKDWRISDKTLKESKESVNENNTTTFSKEEEGVLPLYIKGSSACFLSVSCDNNSPKWYLIS